jgi:hypothetical protein
MIIIALRRTISIKNTRKDDTKKEIPMKMHVFDRTIKMNKMYILRKIIWIKNKRLKCPFLSWKGVDIDKSINANFSCRGKEKKRTKRSVNENFHSEI